MSDHSSDSDSTDSPVEEESQREEAAEGEPSDGREADVEGDGQPVEILDPLEEAQAESKKYKEQLLRTAADFDNFRKRSRRELIEADRRGRAELLRELLPVFDNLERAAAHTETASQVASLAEGIRMVMRQFGDTLEKLGIGRVPSVGQVFDPALHEAIQQVPSADHPPGTIIDEVQAGYTMGDRLVRPAMVLVATAAGEKVGSEPPASDSDGGSDGAPGGVEVT